MKKKTILVAAIAVMLVAALVVGGTLAYFTDKDNATGQHLHHGQRRDHAR